MEQALCNTCQRPIGTIKVAIHGMLIQDLFVIYKWARANGRHEFEMKDVRGIISRSSYCNITKLVYTGLMYKKKHSYGLNLPRCEEFFAKKRSVATLVEIDRLTKETTLKEYRYVSDVPNLQTFLDGDGYFRAHFYPYAQNA